MTRGETGLRSKVRGGRREAKVKAEAESKE